MADFVELMHEVLGLAPILAQKAALIHAAPFRKLNSLRPSVRLPSEVLEEIFLGACTAPGRRQTRSAIAATCHRWREIAITIPWLWSCISLENRRNYDRPTFPPLELLTLELHRAKSQPLDVLIQFDGANSNTWKDLVQEIIPFLSQSRSIQLRSVAKRGRAGTCWSDVILSSGRGPRHFPRLRTLIWDQQKAVRRLNLSGAPNLRNLALSGNLSLSNISPHSLTELRIYCSMSGAKKMALETLVRCTSLQTLVWEFSPAEITEICRKPLPKLHFPDLQHLEFCQMGVELGHNNSDASQNEVLQSIVALRVESLRLSILPSVRFERQFPQLKVLHLGDIVKMLPREQETEEGTLTEILSHLSSITHLTLPRPSSVAFLQALIGRKEEDGRTIFRLLPLLAFLEIEIKWGDPDRIPTLEYVVLVRNGVRVDKPGLPFKLRLVGDTLDYDGSFADLYERFCHSFSCGTSSPTLREAASETRIERTFWFS